MHLATFSDAESVRQKIVLAQKYNLRGVALFKIDGLSDPGRAESYRISGYDKIADGDFQGAFEDLMEAIHLDPQNYRCYGLRGVTHYELGRYAEAIADECKAINMNPTPDTLYNRSEAYYKTGKDEEALRDLEYALELAHEISSNHYLIPEIHKLIGIIKDKTVSLKLTDVAACPSVTETVMTQEPDLSVAGVMVRVRLAPDPPSTILAFGTSV